MRWTTAITTAVSMLAIGSFCKNAHAQECVAVKPENFSDLPEFNEDKLGNGCHQDASEHKCGDLDYCYGVMISHETAYQRSCCDLFPSCRDTMTLIDSIEKLRRLSLADLIISIIICIFSSIQTITLITDRANENRKHWSVKLALLILVLEIVDLGMSSAIIHIASRRNSDGNDLADIADALIGAGCFSDPHDYRKIGTIYDELNTFKNFQSAELAFECVLVLLHFGKIGCSQNNAHDAEKIDTVIAFVLDLMEVALAAVAYIALVSGINEFHGVYESMKKQTAVNACIYTWCFVEALKASGGAIGPNIIPLSANPTLRLPEPTLVPTPDPNPISVSAEHTSQDRVPSDSPLVTGSREESLRRKVSSISGEATLNDSSSPQSRALNWLTYVDPKKLDDQDPSLKQRYGLALLYFALGGSLWKSHVGWLNGTSECEWEHVACDENYQVYRIILDSNGCIGVIPREIFLFDKLEMLSFAQNNINGVLPQGMFELRNLKLMKLQDTNVYGTIPGAIGNLTDLQHLDMSNTDLSGPLPLTELSRLSNLEVLQLGTNNVRGMFDYTERLESNYDRQPMPSSIRNLKKLTKLRINAGSLSGSIPSEIGELTSLVSLELYSNFLEGSIPSTIGNLINLQSLRLNLNSLTGTIPSSLSLLSSLDTLRLEENEQLSGTLPTGICTETLVPSSWGVWVTCNVQCCVDCCSLCFGGRPDDLPCD